MTLPWIDWGILILFAIDYFVRLFLATNKRKFFRENIFDLLAIIPFDAFFSPHTGVGRLAAILLMSLGIGFIGVLTSSITSYFAEETDQKDMDELMTELETIRKENSEIKQELTKLNQHLDAQKNANHKDD